MNKATVETKTKWVSDPTHSELLFKVKHLMITNVKGEFRKFNVDVEAQGDDFSNASVTATVDAASIFTNEDNRDGHLKSADFFDVATWPELTFQSTGFTKIKGDEYELSGILTIKGQSNPVILSVAFGGWMKDPYGNEKAGFSVTGEINRKDFGLTWNAALETGGVMVSDQVKILAEIQLVKQK